MDSTILYFVKYFDLILDCYYTFFNICSVPKTILTGFFDDFSSVPEAKRVFQNFVIFCPRRKFSRF